MNEKVAYWTDIAQYDLDTAEAMFQTGRWLYVGFMCHQVVEKMLKAYHVSLTGKQAAYTHDLKRLASDAGLMQELSEEQKMFIASMGSLNIESRYPEHKQALQARLTPESCRRIINNTKEFKQWIEQKL